MKKAWIGGLAVAVVAAVAAVVVLKPFDGGQADKVRIGFVSTFSKGPAAIGQDMKDAVELALDKLDRKVGGVETEVIYADDEFNPEVGRLRSEELVSRDKVDFAVGYIWSNVLLQARAPVLKSDAFLISANAGPSQLAGSECHENFFAVSWQNDQTPEAMGQYLTDAGIKRLFVIAPNYPAGKDMVSGVKRTYKGEVVGEILTPWPDHADWAAEFARVRASDPAPDAIFVFYPGAAGVKFLNQYDQSGLKQTVPLYHVYTTDATTLPAQGDAAIGTLGTLFWGPDMDVPASKEFVDGFKGKYGRYPSFYAAQTYDAIMLIDSAVRATGGDLADKDALRAALRKADFTSVRGDFKFNNNHFPIQDFYLHEVVKDEAGVLTTRTVAKVFENHGDAYAKDCKMSW